MTLQWILVALTALFAGVYLFRLSWLAWTASGCGTGCACPSKPAKTTGLISANELTARVNRRTSGET